MADLREVSGHFNVTVQTMLEYVKKHKAEINYDGEHAKKANGKWIFDDIAIKRIEKLKGFGVAGVMEVVESDKVKDLKILVDNLQTALLTAQNEALQATKQLAESEKERRLLAESRINEVEELATLREKIKAMEKDYKSLLEINHNNEKITKSIYKKLEKMKNSNLFERIFKMWESDD